MAITRPTAVKNSGTSINTRVMASISAVLRPSPESVELGSEVMMGFPLLSVGVSVGRGLVAISQGI